DAKDLQDRIRRDDGGRRVDRGEGEDLPEGVDEGLRLSLRAEPVAEADGLERLEVAPAHEERGAPGAGGGGALAQAEERVPEEGRHEVERRWQARRRAERERPAARQREGDVHGRLEDDVARGAGALEEGARVAVAGDQEVLA